eukprot:COSAG02_NODE_3643_length_6435_cov_3.264994_4_plen_41_part_00
MNKEGGERAANLMTTDWSILFWDMFLYALFASSYTCGGSF